MGLPCGVALSPAARGRKYDRQSPFFRSAESQGISALPLSTRRGSAFAGEFLLLHQHRARAKVGGRSGSSVRQKR